MTDIGKPKVDTRKRISVIWMIPILALVIGVWMVVDAKLSQGPTIQISFDNADGLVAGKTKVEYLNVYVGQVEDVVLNESMDGVIATVQMNPEAKYLLNEDSEFWVVRARAAAGNITGLSTLLGGAYIELSPGEADRIAKEFVGLETPPLTPTGAPGLKLNLFSKQAGSVSAGDAVLYNGYKVGRIEAMAFDEAKNLVRYDMFIDAPYDKLVNSSVRFWNVSGISLNASASGIDFRTGSLDTVLFGGVSFELPEGVSVGEPVQNGAEFHLYDDYEQLLEQPYDQTLEYVVEFIQSMRGLVPGAPVEYRGVQIGTVKEILFEEMLEHTESGNGSPIPVLISMEPGRLGLEDTAESLRFMRESIEQGVQNGLRASLETGNLLTGSLYVSMDYHESVEPVEATKFADYDTIPTIHVGLARIEEQVTTFLNKLNALPLEQTVENVDQMVSSATATFNSMTTTLNSIDEILSDRHTKQLSEEVTAAIKDFRMILEGFAPGGQNYQSFESSVENLNETLSNLNQLTNRVKDQPNALVFPTNFPADPIPGAK